MSTLAIDIGGTKFTVALFENGRICARHTEATDREGGRDWMIARISSLCREWKFERCGIGFGGPVLFDQQKVALSTHVGGWSDFQLPRAISSMFSVPAIMDNDANAGALGEAIHGAGRGCVDLFYVTLSTGIGGGIVAGGHVYRGADSYAGEIGHVVIAPGGPQCLCGSFGCFERMCGGLWLEQDFGRTAKDLLHEPDFVAVYVSRLAAGLKTIIMILNPARIVIGGGIAKAGESLFGPLREELRRQATAWSRARIDVQPAGLGDDSVLYGAMELAKNL